MHGAHHMNEGNGLCGSSSVPAVCPPAFRPYRFGARDTGFLARIAPAALVTVLTVHAATVATAAPRSAPAERATARAAAAASPVRQDSAIEDAFWDALARDDAARLQTFLLRGVDTNIVHPEHGPAIVAAARERAWSVVRALAAIVGTRIDAPNQRGETAAMLAALRGNLDIVRLLVEKGAQLNRPGWTVLHYAAVDGNVELLQYLLDQNAYIDAESPNRTTPLMMAARHENIDAVRLLIAAGADPTPRNDAGLDAAGYLSSHKMMEEAHWLREQAETFDRRYRGADRAGATATPKTGAGAGISPEPVGRARPAERAKPPVRLPGMRD